MLGQDGVRGAELALKEADYTAGGKKIEIIKGSSDASPDSAVKAARKLVEQDGVAILIGPLSGDEGLAVKDYAKTQPNVTFVNGTSAAQDTTLARSRAEFLPLHHRRRAMDGGPRRLRLQRQEIQDRRHGRRGLFLSLHAGVRLHGRLLQGRRPCAEEVLGADRQQGLLLGHRRDPRQGRRHLCRARRRRRRQLPHPVPAGRRHGAADRRLDHRRPDGARHARASSATMSSARLRPARSPTIRTIPPGRNSSPTTRPPTRTASRRPRCSRRAITSTPRRCCWRSTRSTAICPDDEVKFRDALSKLEFDTPTGKVKLDKNRQAIADNYLTEVAKADDGNLYNKVIKVMPAVNQTLGIPEADFLKLGVVGPRQSRLPVT